MALPVEVLSLVRARNALSRRFLPRTGLHALVLGGCRQEGAGLLFGSGLADAALVSLAADTVAGCWQARRVPRPNSAVPRCLAMAFLHQKKSCRPASFA